ncbi:N-acyl-phosphatidylethanolamine-hydrolyzing phospholipase D, partial [Phenoliferia sp. Uapishka_3]
MLALPVIVSLPTIATSDASAKGAHHTAEGHFTNPWESFKDHPTGIFGLPSASTMFSMFQDWRAESKPSISAFQIPAPEFLPQVIKPNWGRVSVAEAAEDGWRKDIKIQVNLAGTRLLPGRIPRETEWRTRCEDPFRSRVLEALFSESMVTPPPFALAELPEVDAVILSHNHYDHTDVTTLKHIYAAQPKGTVHFFAPLGNKKWFEGLGFKSEHVTELDCDQINYLRLGGNQEGSKFPSQLRQDIQSHPTFASRRLRVNIFRAEVSTTYTTLFRILELSLTPLHIQRCHTLWASWAVEHLADDRETATSKVWFGGDTGQYALPSSQMTEPPKRLRSACEAKGLTKNDFDVCDIGETVRVTPEA